MKNSYHIVEYDIPFNRFWVIEKRTGSVFNITFLDYYIRVTLLIMAFISLVTLLIIHLWLIISALAIFALIILALLLLADLFLIRSIRKIRGKNTEAEEIIVITPNSISPEAIQKYITLFEENKVSEEFLYAIRLRYPFLYPLSLLLEIAFLLLLLRGLLITSQFWNPLVYITVIVLYYVLKEMIKFIASVINYYLYSREHY
ncbi:MAG: hypothetical protein ACTSX9_09440 [Candidatus Njordarchaeales archaeon]